MSIVVTDAVFSRGLFTVGGSVCDPGQPACLDGFVFTANDTGPCVVGVRTHERWVRRSKIAWPGKNWTR